MIFQELRFLKVVPQYNVMIYRELKSFPVSVQTWSALILVSFYPVLTTAAFPTNKSAPIINKSVFTMSRYLLVIHVLDNLGLVYNVYTSVRYYI